MKTRLLAWFFLLAAETAWANSGVAAVGQWQGEFTLPGANASIHTVLRIDDTILVGGEFTLVDDVRASRVARWDGERWHPMGLGVHGVVKAATVWRGQIVIGGDFEGLGNSSAVDLAVWDGDSWIGAGEGILGRVEALSVFEDDLIAGGLIYEAGGQPVRNVARWDGSAWHALGEGTETRVYTMEEFAGELIVAGLCVNCSLPQRSVMGWDGSQWRVVGAGLVRFNPNLPLLREPYVYDLQVYGGELYAGGLFDHSGRLHPMRSVARWDGELWRQVEGPTGGLRPPGGNGNVRVRTLESWNGLLVVAGQFDVVGHPEAKSLVGWNGEAWQAIDDVPGQEDCFRRGMFLDMASDESQLIAVGDFLRRGSSAAAHVARWDKTAWSPLGEFRGQGLSGPVHKILRFQGDIHAAGEFTMAGGRVVNHIARWDGTEWHPLQGGFGSDCEWRGAYDMVEYADELVVCGRFTEAGNVEAQSLASWNGQRWRPLPNSPVFPLHLSLYRGRLVASDNGHIWEFDGSSWRELGIARGGGIQALAVYQDELVIAGNLSEVNGVPCEGWARWDGESWFGLAGSPSLLSSRSLLAAPFGLLLASGSRVLSWNGFQVETVTYGSGGSILALKGFGIIGAHSSAQNPLQGGTALSRFTGSEWVPLTPSLKGVPLTLYMDGGTLWVGGKHGSVESSSWFGVTAWNEPEYPLVNVTEATARLRDVELGEWSGVLATIRWTVDQASFGTAFHVYSEVIDGTRERSSRYPITGLKTQKAHAVYEPDQTVAYWLLQEELNGATQWIGPIKPEPVAIYRSNFTARRDGSGVVLEWLDATPSQRPFRVYRESENGRRVLLDTDVLAVEGGRLSCLDKSAPGRGTTYWLRLSGESGGWLASDRVPARDAPSRPFLGQNVPNPFNPETEVRFELPRRDRVRLDVYNVAGQRVASLLDEQRDAGSHSVTWRGRADSGEVVASGIYYCRMVVGQRVFTREMVLLK